MLRRSVSLALFAASLALACSAAPAAEKRATRPAAAPAKEESVDWKIVKHEGRDYLTLENIARFYKLKGNLTPTERKVLVSNGRFSLQVTGESRSVVINGVVQWLSFPARYQDGQMLISRFDLAKTIEPALRPQVVQQVRPFKTVVIDAGHGGHDKGAASTLGWEKDYNLLVSKELKTLFEKRGLKVVMTRDTDIFLPLEERARRANAVPDSIFVCVHFNAAPGNAGDASGFEVFALAPRGAPATHDEYTYADLLAQLPGHDFENASLALATAVQHALVGNMQEFDRGVKRARFAVLKLTKSPSLLIEGGFLSNAQDGRQIHDPLWRRALCESIADGVEAYRGLAQFHRFPRLVADYKAERLPTLGRLVNVDAPSSAFPVSNTIPISFNHRPAMGPRED